MNAGEKFVPDFRFPDFNDNWQNKKFKEVLTLQIRPLRMDDETTYSLVTVKRRFGGVVKRCDFKGKKIKVKSQFILETNDFLISKRQAPHCACGLVPKELNGSIVSNEYSVFNPQSNLDINYFNYFCNLVVVSRTFFLSSIGVHIEKMLFKVDDWFKWSFYYPSLPEQQKIAAFLSAVDQKIEKLTRKKDLLQSYKKGVMQKIFSQEIRFKADNGNDFPDWEEKRLGAVSNFFSGGTPNTATRSYYEGDIPFIKSGEIGSSFTKQFINEDAIANSSAKLVEKGDLLYALYGATAGEIAISKLNGAINQAVLCLRPEMQNEFLYFYFLLTKSIILKTYLQGGQGNLSADIIKKLKIPVVNEFEQKKIANFLSHIDKKIEAVDQQLSHTQSFKKGLLQRMFV